MSSYWDPGDHKHNMTQGLWLQIRQRFLMVAETTGKELGSNVGNRDTKRVPVAVLYSSTVRRLGSAAFIVFLKLLTLS